MEKYSFWLWNTEATHLFPKWRICKVCLRVSLKYLKTLSSTEASCMIKNTSLWNGPPMILPKGYSTPNIQLYSYTEPYDDWKPCVILSAAVWRGEERR